MACHRLFLSMLVAGFTLIPLMGQATTIYDVQYNETTQGTGDDCYSSPLDGQVVTIEGIVTAVKSGQFPNFWLEDASGGLWQGVYIFDSTIDPSRGDRVSLSASVDEYYGMTEIKNVTSSEIISSGNTVPDPVDISTADLAGGCNATAEACEGVLVRVNNVTCTTLPNDYGEWYVDDGSGQCQIDDYLYEHSPALGDTFDFIVGVVQYGFGEYEINPRSAADFGVEPPQPAESIYDVQYNETNQGTGEDCYPSPYKDQEVTIEGVVTAVWVWSLGSQYPDFWLQTLDKGSWSGVFVYDTTVEPERGDFLTITATPDEYFGLTEMKNVSSFEVNSSGNPMPAPVNISTADLAGGCNAVSEAYEGVLVRVSNVTCTATPNEYGEWLIDDGSGECQVDDYIYSYTPTLGEEFSAIVGIVHWGYGEYKLLPRDAGDINPTAVQDRGRSSTLPSAYSLSQNYPNPFNPETEIRFALPQGAYVRLEVFNLLGQKVATLADGPQEVGGEFSVRWNGTSDAGLSLASGIYFYRLQAGEFSDTKKMIYLK
jgi:hypothetical protein